MTVDLFVTCLNDALFPRTGIATVRLLERLGHTVRFNKEQTCCGQMHFNSGYRDQALSLIRRMVDIYRDSEVIITPSASCAAMVRCLYPDAAEQAGDTKLADAARDLATRIYELSEFLASKLGLDDVGAYFPHAVSYHPTCHSLRLLKIGDSPQRLLSKVKWLTLNELAFADQCCGFGGTFSIKNPETSTAMMQDKISNFDKTEAEFLCALDNSCLMHIGGGMSRQGSPERTIHIAEILASTEREPYR